MALIKKLIRMKKKNGSDIILSYPQTVDENVLCDNEAMTLKTKTSNLQSGIDGKAPISHASSSTTYGVATASNYGHVRATAGNGLSLSNGTVSMSKGTTSAAGALQLTDSTSSTSTTTAATPASVKATYDLAGNAKTKADSISNPNLLINGDFKIWQRGDYFLDPPYVCTADRWFSHSIGNSTIEKADNGAKITGFVRLIYIMEDAEFECIKGKTVTLSYSHDGVITTSSFAAESNSPLIEAVWPTGTLNWIKLELGSVATPFVPRSYAEELALCQRYYEKVTFEEGHILRSVKTNELRGDVAFKVTKRVPPVVMAFPMYAVHMSNSGVYGAFVLKTPGTNVSVDSSIFYFEDNQVNSVEPGQYAYLSAVGGGAMFMEFDAEIY